MKSKTYTKWLLIAVICISNTHLFSQSNAVFKETELSKIKPKGWLNTMLKTQRDGLTGNIAVSGKPFTFEGWGYAKDKKMDNWEPFEQTAYWADGALRCGYLIDDNNLKERVKKWITYQIDSAAIDGSIGPKDIKSLWPEVVFFRAMMAEYSATKDKKVLDALIRNYNSPKYAKLSGKELDYSGERMMLHIEMMLWLYQQTNDVSYINRSVETYDRFCGEFEKMSLSAFLSDAIPHWHGVSYAENIKIPALLYMYTGKKLYLDAAQNAIRKVYKYHGLVDGLPSCNEGHDGSASNQVHETCTATDMQWTLGYMLEATGDAKWADLIEKICFNAGMGSVTKDFKSHQYYSGPNQCIADSMSSHWNSHVWFCRESTYRMAYRLNFGVFCCTGNINRLLPVFSSRMWMTKGDDGIVASLYSPSTYTTKIGKNGEEVTIDEMTNYPFDENVKFKISTKEATAFSLWVRIPEWCKKGSITINGKKSAIKCEQSTYVEVKRSFQNGDVVSVDLPMEVQVVPWQENGMAFERGPLVYSYSVPTKATAIETRQLNGQFFSTYDMKPDGNWNYAPLVGIGKEAVDVKVVKSTNFENPWNPLTTPVQLEVNAVPATNWEIRHKHFTPVLPGFIDKGAQETIKLVPLGTTTLRLTIFPDLEKRFSKQ